MTHQDTDTNGTHQDTDMNGAHQCTDIHGIRIRTSTAQRYTNECSRCDQNGAPGIAGKGKITPWASAAQNYPVDIHCPARGKSELVRYFGNRRGDLLPRISHDIVHHDTDRVYTIN